MKMPDKQKAGIVLKLITNHQFEVIRLKEAPAFKNELLSVLVTTKKP